MYVGLRDGLSNINEKFTILELEEDGDLDLLAGQLHGANASLLVQVSITLRCKIRQL